MVILLLMILVVLAGGLYAYAEQACPAPSWVFWIDGAPRINFGFTECLRVPELDE